MLTRRLFSFKYVDIKFHHESREALFKGIDSLSKAVASTLGPKVTKT